MHQIASQGVFISKNFRWGLPSDPPRKIVAFGHSELLPQKINPRWNPASVFRQCFNLVLRGLPVFKYTNYCHITNVTMLFRWNHNLHALKIEFQLLTYKTTVLVFTLSRHHVRQKLSFR